MKGLVLDLDGVVYRGDEPVPGAPEAIARARGQGVRVVFCTNNSRPTVEDYVARLARMGVRAAPEEIVTSAVVTGEVLARRGAAGRRALVVGGEGLRAALRAAGMILLGPDEPPLRADYVVVGWDPSFDWEAMRRAADAARAGAALVATNDDATYPGPDGALWPGAGAILASIERASGRRAEVMGKPHRPMMEVAAARLGDVDEVTIVGDRPDTDLEGGRAMGWRTVLVLSGVTSRKEAARLHPPPDLVLGSLAELEL